jgi:hypothetical protein
MTHRTGLKTSSWVIIISFVKLTNTVGFTKLDKYVYPNTVLDKRTVPFCSAELAKLRGLRQFPDRILHLQQLEFQGAEVHVAVLDDV